METISQNQWVQQFRRIEKANLKNHHRSTSWVSMMNQSNNLIIETREDTKTLTVQKGWRAELKQRFLTPNQKNEQAGIEIIRGEDARRIAERKARYGHRDWLVWTDKDDERCTALASSESIKMAMLATGTQKQFLLIHKNDATGWIMDWSMANIYRRNLRFFEKGRGL